SSLGAIMRPWSSRMAVRSASLGYAILWMALAIAPLHRDDWLLENALVAGLLGVLLSVRRWFRFSDASLLLLLAFLALHAIGSHDATAEVPYDKWWTALTGHTLHSVFGWERNHFDRLVHFCYGLLLAYPLREFFLRIVAVRGF